MSGTGSGTGSGGPGPGFALDASKLQLVADLEIEMMSDMYNRMTRACHKKCIPPKYRDSELNKGESVCIDRCVAKYLDVHEKIGKKLTTLSMQDEDMMKKLQQQDAQASQPSPTLPQTNS